MQIQEQVIAEIAKEVVARLRVQMQLPDKPATAAPSIAARDGVFATVDEAVNAAYEAQKKVAALSLDERGKMVDIIVRICNDRREELGRMEMEETKVGRLDHKILKLTNMRFVLARALGRHRHDAAGHSLGAHHGLQRHQYSCRWQHRNFRAAPVGRKGGALRAATLQSRDRAGIRLFQRANNHA